MEEIIIISAVQKSLELLQDVQPGPNMLAELNRMHECFQSKHAGTATAAAFKRHNGVKTLMKILATKYISPHAKQSAARMLISHCVDNETYGVVVRTFEFGQHVVYCIEKPFDPEASGYGWCVWGGARVLCTLLLTVPELLENRSVLEIGSGVGLCGLFAGLLGAAKVTLTDYTPDLIETLNANVEIMTEANPSCRDRFHVRWLNWGDEEQAYTEATSQTGPTGEKDGETLSVGQKSWKQGFNIGLKDLDKFDVIIGSDLLYSEESPQLLASTIWRRLAPRGQCELLLPIRKPELLAVFVDSCHQRGLCTKVEAKDDCATLREVQQDGYVFVGGVVLCHISRSLK